MADSRDLAVIDSDSGEFDLAGLLRLAGWGTGAAAALLLAVLAGLSGPGSKRAVVAFTAVMDHGPTALMATKAHPDPGRVTQAERETQRLSEQVRSLTADRGRLALRVSALEHNLEDLTGSIKRAEVAAAKAAVAPQPRPAPQIQPAIPGKAGSAFATRHALLGIR